MANEWQYICTKCGHQVTSDVDFCGTCPSGHSSWMCHGLDGGFKAEKAGDKASEAMIRRADNLSQGFQLGANRALPNLSEKDKPGPKPRALDDVVRELAGQGLSSRAIAARLNEQGISVSYRTVLRRLQGVLLHSEV